MSRFLPLAVLVFLLSGCGPLLNPYHEHFKCRTPDDSGACVDVATAYGHATGALSLDKGAAGCRTGKDAGAAAGRDDYLRAQYRRLAGLLAEPEPPILTPPRVMRGLILAYPGADGALFMPRYIYFEVDEGRWIFGEEKRKREEKKP
ncbi:MAG: TraV family lipoprotein [Desulfobacteraceae bacterium]|nr:TraV family lipoprotein [Desulfobacteraceae bacterium]